jgi:putative Mg2+ transporter-C (MgtC) family protein
MPVTIDWPEIILRLSLAMLAGGVLGLNRTERGMSAGLRTTLLVTLAATVSMIQVNLLLATVGKTTDSFSVLDLMRLPLGILTGMGFIGAGAILRKGDRVSGVTTAATLWLATSLGLCFGGGQHGLGLTALALGVLILWALKRLESNLPQERRATLMLNIASGGPADQEIRAMVDQGHGRITKWDATYFCKGRRKISCEVHWQSKSKEPPVPDFVRQLVDTSGVRSVRWRRM